LYSQEKGIQRIGAWREYSTKDGELKNIATIAFDRRPVTIKIFINQGKRLQGL
jgi:hypothetical protein